MGCDIDDDRSVECRSPCRDEAVFGGGLPEYRLT
jgi:hypothetical protein